MPTKVRPSLVIPPLVLALIGISLGVFPFLIQDLISDATLAMTPDTQVAAFSLALDSGPGLESRCRDAGHRRADLRLLGSVAPVV